MTVCACLGPQNGQPLCPCQMRAGASCSYFAPQFLPLTRPRPPFEVTNPLLPLRSPPDWRDSGPD